MDGINSLQTKNSLFIIFAIIFFSIVCVANNLIPFYSLPTQGQAFWAVGFAQSIANGPLMSVHATNFGIPYGADIAFGLSAVLPMSFLLRLGVNPANSYAFIFIAYLLLAFYSAYKIGLRFNLNKFLSVCTAALWLISPVIIQHANYSMLSLGMALLPYYFLSLLFVVQRSQSQSVFFNILFCFFYYALAMLISVFMDGYTFVMIAVLNTSYLLYCTFYNRGRGVSSLVAPAIIHILSLTLAYFLYTTFIGKSGYEPQELDFFRGWGIDLSFLIMPTSGIFWLFDFLHLSVHRTEQQFYGDNSVWRTSFILPSLICFILLFKISGRKKISSFSLFLMLIFLFSLYFSLGPSLKFFTTKPFNNFADTPLMSADKAMFATGTGWISQHIPGFKVMRAAYRWIALSFFMLWCLIILALAKIDKLRTSLIIIIGTIVLYFPDLTVMQAGAVRNYEAFSSIDQQVVRPLKTSLATSDVVAFVPFGNDFIVNYLASELKIKAYNIGGDKNLNQSMLSWPENLLTLKGALSSDKAGRIISLLSRGEADAVVIPYFDLLWSAHIWPCKMANTPAEVKAIYPDFSCPAEKHKQLQPIIDQLLQLDFISVTSTPLYSVLKLNNTPVIYPVSFQSNSLQKYRVLGDGWYYPENGGVWSSGKAKLMFSLPSGENQHYTLRVWFTVYSASKSTPKKVLFINQNSKAEQTLISEGHDEHVDLTFSREEDAIVNVAVVNPSSPSFFNQNDKRVLGVYLTKIEQRP